MANVLFIIFATIALIAAAMVILAKNPVRAVLFLILTFFATAANWLLLGAEFLALTLVLVYVGAVMVLFLFVVMMLDIDFATVKASFTRWSPIGVALAAAVFVLLSQLLKADHLYFGVHAKAGAEYVSNVTLLGQLVFTQYLLQFEIAGILLLVAIIAAIVLVYRGPRDRITQNIAKQIAANPKDRVRLVDGV